MSRDKNKFRSMTGYAVIERKIAGLDYRFHLKSVNHRYMEMRVRLPRKWMPFETELRLLAQKQLQRGSFDLWVDDFKTESEKGQSDLLALFVELRTALEVAQAAMGNDLSPEALANFLARFPETWFTQKKMEEVTGEQDALIAVVRDLFQALDESRLKEGHETGKALRVCFEELQSYLKQILAEAPQLRSAWESHLRTRLQKMSDELKAGTVSEERMLQEFLILAEKRDVAEELQRIGSHLKAFDELLSHPTEQLGKRLEQLMQEFHREWTTLGNKIQNALASKLIMEAKLTLEKIREQSLNLV